MLGSVRTCGFLSSSYDTWWDSPGDRELTTSQASPWHGLEVVLEKFPLYSIHTSWQVSPTQPVGPTQPLVSHVGSSCGSASLPGLATDLLPGRSSGSWGQAPGSSLLRSSQPPSVLSFGGGVVKTSVRPGSLSHEDATAPGAGGGNPERTMCWPCSEMIRVFFFSSI